MISNWTFEDGRAAKPPLLSIICIVVLLAVYLKDNYYLTYILYHSFIHFLKKKKKSY
jgi:hypothetical protein